MSKLSKLTATAIVTLAGAASLLFGATAVAALAESGPAQGQEFVVADSPWDQPKP